MPLKHKHTCTPEHRPITLDKMDVVSQPTYAETKHVLDPLSPVTPIVG